MSISSQKKRIRQQRYIFFLACLASLAGLIFYICGRHKIRLPLQWLPKIGDLKEAQRPRLFCFGINIHLQVNFALGFLFMLFNREKTDQVKLKKWKYWISKVLILVLSLASGIGQFGKYTEGGWFNIFLLCLIITVVNCCLLELLIQLMDQYGICSAFNLILFTEFLPTDWFKSEWNQRKSLELFGLFFITVCFVWITNLKWEVPIDTNTLYSQDNKLLKRKKSKLGFKLSFSFMPLIYLSQLISFIYSIFLMRELNTGWLSSGEISTNWDISSSTKKFVSDTSYVEQGKGFWGAFFTLNENKAIFDFKNLRNWFGEKKWMILGALSFLIILRWLVMWLQMRYMQWKPEEVSKDLRERGIYVDGVAPGLSTQKLLKPVINKLVFFWNIVILIFNVIFDSLFPVMLIFSSWFGGVNIGVDLFKQIRTKYRYIRANK